MAKLIDIKTRVVHITEDEMMVKLFQDFNEKIKEIDKIAEEHKEEIKTSNKDRILQQRKEDNERVKKQYRLKGTK